MTRPSPQSRFSFKRLCGLVSWNFAGLALPLVAAAFVIPVLLDKLGAERFGLLTLIWTLIGYCSLFDLGLGRGLTAVLVGQDGRSERVGTARNALSCLSLLGLCAGALVGLLAQVFPSSYMSFRSTDLAREIQHALYVTAATVPFVVVTSGLRGVLEAELDFATLSALRAVIGISTFVGPLVAVQYSSSVAWAVVPLLVTRIAAGFAHAWVVTRKLPGSIRPIRPSFGALRPLFRIGGWITVSSILNPLLVSMDRFIIVGIFSASVVAYYSTPQEIVARLLVFPAAVLGVWFPAMCHGALCPDELRSLLKKGVILIGSILIPTAALLSVYSHTILTTWLGQHFADRASDTLSILALGLSVNAVAHIPLALLHAVRRADIPAKFHLAELPFYLTLSIVLAGRFGIEGAAAAWSLRAGCDAVLLFVAARRQVASQPMLVRDTACTEAGLA